MPYLNEGKTWRDLISKEDVMQRPYLPNISPDFGHIIVIHVTDVGPAFHKVQERSTSNVLEPLKVCVYEQEGSLYWIVFHLS